LNVEFSQVSQVIGVVLGGSYKLLTWLTTNKISNKQKIVPGVFELVVETSKEEVDLLLNKIETLKRPFSMNILK